MNYNFSCCTLCPRECGADRTKTKGLCGADIRIKAAKAQLHYWEEPCLSGEKGSGAVFFSGCTLKCVFCQNYTISKENNGIEISSERLGEIFIELQEQGANNINLVNPTHYVPQIIDSLQHVKHRLTIPIVYNTGGYEKISTLKMLDKYVDIYLPDLKYTDSNISEKYSKAGNYFEYAKDAILEMHRQQPKLVLENGILKKGLIIRHMILPHCRHDSISVIKWLGKNLPNDSFLFSLMSQYTPNSNCNSCPEINRRITTFEYNSVLKAVEEYNFNGYSQARSSAQSAYTPDFNLDGIIKN
ncbi:MAG: radical SAM protein [Clostridium sp.]|nr:radical SAM protein [Clostridium sp.]MCM1546860.1 radical SAM protein [Ruminococcus sp.]